METTTQAQAPVPANPIEPQAPGAQAPVPANGSPLPPEAQQYVVNPANEPANTPPAQAQVQAQEESQKGVTELYQLLNQRQIENYQLQQQLQAERQARQQPQQQTVQTEQNPYDPNVNWWEAIKWENNKAARDAARFAAQETKNELIGFAQQSYQQQQEIAWQQAHPTVDINLVKAWGQQNGVSNLNYAYQLMTLPNAMQAAQTAGAQQAFQQFKQPTNVPVTLRGAQPAGGQSTGLSYEAMAKDFVATQGRVYNSWSPELQKVFDQETRIRDVQRRNK